MSGDVQPRKRRDKKRKKDEGEEPHHPRGPSLTPLENDDVTIHVEKDAHTGGGICAKFVFFILFSALAVLIGLIITEHRGLTDLDTIERQSSFAQYFEGWVDNAPEDHDDHHGLADHDDEHDNHDDEHDDDHDGRDEDHDDEDEHEDEDEEDEPAPASDEVGDEEDEVKESVQESNQEEEDEEEAEEDGTEESDEEEPTHEDDDEEGTQEYDERDVDEDDVSEAPNTEEDGVDKEEDDEPLASQEEGVDAETSREEVTATVAQDEEEEEDDKEEEDADNTDGEDQLDDAAEREKGDTTEQPVTVVKAAVGLVILVVAYVVLIRKWKSDEAAALEGAATKTEAQQDLTRRNTIVVPPKVDEVDLNYDDYSENDDDELDDEEEEEYEIQFDIQGRKEYQKLRNTYERSLTPDSDQFDREDEEHEGEDDEEEEPEEEEDDEGGGELEPEEEGEYEPEYDDEEEPPEGEDKVEEGEEEHVSDEDDDELMKKLEAKYGKLSGAQASGENDSEVEEGKVDALSADEVELDVEAEEDAAFLWQYQGGAQEINVPEEESWRSVPSYDHDNITNADDFAINEQLDDAHENLNINAALALSQFATILKTHPRSPRATYGRARALDHLAEQRQNNQLLTEAITNYMKLMYLDGVPSALLKITGERCINRLRFMGQYPKAIKVHRMLIERFPDQISYRNQLAVTYLTTNRMEDARNELKQSLQRWPTDGFALVHYGFILKVHDGDLELAIKYLQQGIATRQEGVVDGRFYFHLGDALARLGRHAEATSVYEDGAKQAVFLSAKQRSLYNVPTLKAQPWWPHQDTPLKYRQFFQQLENSYKSIRDEGLAVMKARGLFQDEAENLRAKGDWKQFELFARGIKHRKNCERCPITCKLVETLPEAVGCRRGQVKFSVMLPGTHVWPHCGPTNCRLRAHLGLKIPEKTFIRVDEEIRSWKQGEIMIFDDSFEHEVWHNGSDFRLVLIVDVWHPELTAAQRRSLPAI